MEQNKILSFIKDVELFKDLTEEELLLLVDKFFEKDYRINEYIFQENSPRKNLYVIYEGEAELVKMLSFGEEKRISYFRAKDFLSESALINDEPYSTSARTVTRATLLVIKNEDIVKIFKENGNIALKMMAQVAQVISRRISHANTRLVNVGSQYTSARTRQEHDLLGNREVPDEYLFGIQTLRAMENFNISGVTLNFYPLLVEALAIVKMAAAKANYDLGLLDRDIADNIVKACQIIIDGNYHKQFVVDMIQGGAGTSTNMNANEVIANLALTLMGHQKGEYEFCHPNNHVNLSQSTNDAYPTAVKIALINSNQHLIRVLESLIISFRNKGKEFSHVLKMGRTQLQDAVPMTLGQEFEAYAATLEEEIQRLNENAKLFLEVNMGATAIGTGINSDPDYSARVVNRLRDITHFEIVLASNLVEATQDTGAFIMYSSALKRLSIKLSKICNDLRLLSSGPRTGLHEINLPPMQPGSSIMPGKVNPVIPEVVNQIAFKVIGNDLTVSLASEAGQLELNVMEPVIVQSIFESIEMLKNGMLTLKYRCIDGITANEKRCLDYVLNSIGLVTALNPILGYETSTALAKEAQETDRGIYELVLEKKLLTKEELDEFLSPQNMLKPQRLKINHNSK